MVPEATVRAGATPEQVAVPAIEYNGALYAGSTHADAVGSAERRTRASFDEIVNSPSLREGYVTTEGRFVS